MHTARFGVKKPNNINIIKILVLVFRLAVLENFLVKFNSETKESGLSIRRNGALSSWNLSCSSDCLKSDIK